MKQFLKLGVIGSGSWAIALVKIITDHGYQVNWWIRNEEALAYIQKKKA